MRKLRDFAASLLQRRRLRRVFQAAISETLTIQPALKFRRLEPRRVLNASFVFDGVDGLVLSNFDDVGNTSSLDASFDSGTDEYVFLLDNGTWAAGVGNVASAGVTFLGSELRVDRSLFLDAADVFDLQILDNNATPNDIALDLTFSGGPIDFPANANNGAIQVDVDGSVAINADINTFGSSISITAVGDITSGSTVNTTDSADSGLASGSITFLSTAGNISLAGDLESTGANHSVVAATASAAGNISLTTDDGGISVAGVNAAGGDATGGGASVGGNGATVTITANDAGNDGTNNISILGDIVTVGGTGVTNGLGGDITIDADNDLFINAALVSGGGAINLDALNDITSDANGTITSTSSVADGTSGLITIDAGGDIDLDDAAVSSNGVNANGDAANILIATVNGNITVGAISALGSGAGAGGNISLDANGVNADAILNGALQTNTLGTVLISADDSVRLNATGNIAALGTGNISLIANAAVTNGDTGDGITMVAGSFINAGTGTAAAGIILLQSTGANGGPITAQALTTRSNTIQINSGNSITLQQAVTSNGGLVDLDAVTSISSTATGTITTTAAANSGAVSGAVDISAGTSISLAASVTTAGAAHNGAAATASNAGIVTIVTTDGAMTLTGINAAGGNATGGGASVGGNGAAVSITVGDAGNDAAHNLSIAGDIVTIGGSGATNGSGADITITVDNNLNVNAALQSGGGAIDLNAGNNITNNASGTITSTSSLADGTSGLITIDAGGAISLNAAAVSSAGAATNGDAANILITTVNGNITVGTISALGNGTGAGGNISLDANGINADAILNGALQTNTLGTVQVSADDSVQLNATSSINALGTGNISVIANAAVTNGDTGDGITMAAGSFINAGTGIAASGSILLQSTGANGGPIVAQALTTRSNTIQINSGNSITLQQAVTSNGGLVDLDAVTSISSTATGTITTTAAANSGAVSGAVDISAGTSINLAASVTTAGAAHNGVGATASNAGIVTIATADGAITLTGINATGGNATGGGASVGGNGAAVSITASDAGNDAAHNISISADVVTVGGTGTTSGSGANITIDADNNLNVNAALQSGGGAIDLDAGGDITNNASGTITSTSSLADGTSGLITIDAGGDVDLDAAAVSSDGAATNGDAANVLITTVNGNITVGTISVLGNGTGAGGNISLDANGINADAILNGALQTNTLGTVQVSADDSVQLNATSSINALGTGNISVIANAAVTNGDTGDGITMAAGSFINAGTGIAASGSILLQSTGANGGPIVAQALTTRSNTIQINSGNSITLQQAVTSNGGLVDLDAVTSISSTATGTITTTAAANSGAVSGAVDISAGTFITLAGNVATTGAAHNGVGATASNAGAITIATADGAITLASVNAAGGNATGGGASVGGNGAAVSITASDAGNDAAHDIVINDSVIAVGGTGATDGAGADITIVADNSIIDGDALPETTDPDVSGRNIILTATGGNIGVTGDIFQGTINYLEVRATGDLTATAPTGAIALTAEVDGTITLNSIDAALFSTGTLTIDDIVVTGDLRIEGADVVANDGTIDLTADRMLFISGQAETMTTTVNQLDVRTGGDLTITSTTAVELLDLDGDNLALASTTATGSVLLNAAGTILVSDDVIAGADGTTTSTGVVNLTATGAAADIIVNDVVLTDAGNITILADNAVRIGDSALLSGNDNLVAPNNDDLFLITTINGSITITADADGSNAGELFMSDDARIIAGRDNTADYVPNTGGLASTSVIALGTVQTGTFARITLSAAEDITLGSVQAANNTVDAVRITSAIGGVVDGGDVGIDIVANFDGALVTIRAATGIGSTNALEISIYAIDLSNSGAGAIQISEVAAGGDLNLVNADNSGLIRVNVAGGSLTVVDAAFTPNNGAFQVTSNTGDIALAASDDLIIDSTITSTSGNISLLAGDDLFVNAGATTGGAGTMYLEASNGNDGDAPVGLFDGINVSAALQSSSGDILLRSQAVIAVNDTITSTSGDIGLDAAEDILQNANIATTTGSVLAVTGANYTMDSTVSVQAAAGNVAIVATSNVTLAAVTAINVGITAGGSINDINAAATNVAATNLSMSAGSSIGVDTDAIDTQVTVLEATASTGIYIIEANALTIGSVADIAVSVSASRDDGLGVVTPATLTQTVVVAAGLSTVAGAGGPIKISANGLLTIDSTVSSGAGDILLVTTADIVVNSAVTSQSGNITIDAGDDISSNASGNISTGGAGDIVLFADNAVAADDGGITLAGSITSGAGEILLLSERHIRLNGAITSTSGSIGLDAAADIIQNANITTSNATPGGGVLLVANNIAMASGVLTQSSNTVILDARSGSVWLGTVQATNVSIHAQNDIRGADPLQVARNLQNVTNLRMVADTGAIGAIGASLRVDTVNLAASADDAIYLNEASDLSITAIAAMSVTISATVADFQDTTSPAPVLTSTAGVLDDLVTATTGIINLVAGGHIDALNNATDFAGASSIVTNALIVEAEDYVVLPDTRIATLNVTITNAILFDVAQGFQNSNANTAGTAFLNNFLTDPGIAIPQTPNFEYFTRFADGYSLFVRNTGSMTATNVDVSNADALVDSGDVYLETVSGGVANPGNLNIGNVLLTSAGSADPGIVVIAGQTLDVTGVILTSGGVNINNEILIAEVFDGGEPMPAIVDQVSTQFVLRATQALFEDIDSHVLQRIAALFGSAGEVGFLSLIAYADDQIRLFADNSNLFPGGNPPGLIASSPLAIFERDNPMDESILQSLFELRTEVIIRRSFDVFMFSMANSPDTIVDNAATRISVDNVFSSGNIGGLVESNVTPPAPFPYIFVATNDFVPQLNIQQPTFEVELPTPTVKKVEVAIYRVDTPETDDNNNGQIEADELPSYEEVISTSKDKIIDGGQIVAEKGETPSPEQIERAKNALLKDPNQPTGAYAIIKEDGDKNRTVLDVFSIRDWPEEIPTEAENSIPSQDDIPQLPPIDLDANETDSANPSDDSSALLLRDASESVTPAVDRRDAQTESRTLAASSFLIGSLWLARRRQGTLDSDPVATTDEDSTGTSTPTVDYSRRARQRRRLHDRFHRDL